MVTILVNGENSSVAETTVAEWLSAAGFAQKRVVVELNGEILRREKWQETKFANGDKVELIGFVGGG